MGNMKRERTLGSGHLELSKGGKSIYMIFRLHRSRYLGHVLHMSNHHVFRRTTKRSRRNSP